MRKQTRKLLLNITTGVAIAAAAAVVFTPATVFAAPGVTTTNVTLRDGPGRNFPSGGAIPGGTRVNIEECENNYCYISDYDGWVSASYLSRGGSGGNSNGSFGISIGSGGVSVSVDTDDDEGGFDDVAEVCFYDRTNYNGSSFCLEEGESDARLGAWDDRIRSIENRYNLDVTVCTRSNFDGNCRTYTSSASSLGSSYSRNISSVEVE
jgi:uncharacterized protein YraI